MTFFEAAAIVRRHKLFVVYGLLLACLAATFSGYRLEDGRLVAKASPTYQSTAVVAVRPGAEHPTTTTVGPPPPTTTPPPTETGNDSSVSTPTTTAVPNTVPLAPLSAVIDSRAMYYTALSLKTVVASPGFAEAVKARAPMMDGTVSAVVAQDTNTMDVVVDGSTPDIAAETMSATLAELEATVSAYSATPATRFALDGVVVSAPSRPRATRSIKAPLTFVTVLAVVLVLAWLVIRAIDALQMHRRQRPITAPPDVATNVPEASLGVAGDDATAADRPSVASSSLAPEPPRPPAAVGATAPSRNGKREEPGVPAR